MNGKLAYLQEKLSTGLWLIPGVICALCAALALVLAAIDPMLADARWLTYLAGLDTPAARELLGVIAGSIIGVGGVAFSVTMVALTLMSGQYGPKLLRSFLEDSGSKITLGLFLGTFVYALVTMMLLGSLSEPGLSVLLALVLAIAALLGFVKFIHDTATDIQADQIVQRVARQLRETLRGLASEENSASRSPTTMAWRQAARSSRPVPIAASGDGYVQAIDYPGLSEWCRSHDCLLQVRLRAGDFAVPGICAFKLYTADPDAPGDPVGELNGFVVLGPMRTPVQDAEYAISQLNQLAARALSPGINDPGTAITCVDWFAAAMGELIDRELPGSVLHDVEGTPRLLTRGLDFAGITKAIYAPLRQLGRLDIAVTARLIESLCHLAELTRRRDRLALLALHGRLIADDALREALPHFDRSDLRRRHRRLQRLTNTAMDPT